MTRLATMSPDYEESMWSMVHMASDVVHESLHARRPRTEADVAEVIQLAMLNCFRAGAIWRDCYLDSPIGGRD